MPSNVATNTDHTNRLSLFSIAINGSWSVGVFYSFSLICESIEAQFQTFVLPCGGRFSFSKDNGKFVFQKVGQLW